MTIHELRTEYTDLTGNRPHGGWKEKRLTAEIAEAKERKAIAAKAEAEREAERAKDRAERDARIAARGPIEDFAATGWRSDDLPEDERELSFIARRMLSDHESATEGLARFAADIAKDPIHALRWGLDAYTYAAKKSVAEEFFRGFDAGMTFAMWKDFAIRATLQGSRSLPRSTNPASNLLESAKLEAWADAAGAAE